MKVRTLTIGLISIFLIFLGCGKNPISSDDENDKNDDTITSFWEPTGELSSDVVSLATQNNGIIYAGTWGDGVYISTDNDNTWTQINNGLTSFYIKALINSQGKMYVGTHGIRIYRYNHSDKTWNKLNFPEPTATSLTSLASSPNGNMYAGTSDGVYISTDNDNTWEQNNRGLFDNEHILSITISIDQAAYLGTLNGVFRRNEDADSWTYIFDDDRMDLVYAHPFKKEAVYGGNSKGFWRSSKYGRMMELATSGLPDGKVRTIVIDPDNGNIYIGIHGEGVFKSTNNGDSWSKLNDGLTNLNVNTLGISPDRRLLVGTDDGVLRSTEPLTQ
ncbi:MAG: hypothetical protein IIA61_09120 [Candidatus Marinimicrobia bacterium]|nr:hypothetical protein [Candidatus Neomarinimicrobiota bacterium]